MYTIRKTFKEHCLFESQTKVCTVKFIPLFTLFSLAASSFPVEIVRSNYWGVKYNKCILFRSIPSYLLHVFSSYVRDNETLKNNNIIKRQIEILFVLTHGIT